MVGITVETTHTPGRLSFSPRCGIPDLGKVWQGKDGPICTFQINPLSNVVLNHLIDQDALAHNWPHCILNAFPLCTEF